MPGVLKSDDERSKYTTLSDNDVGVHLISLGKE